LLLEELIQPTKNAEHDTDFSIRGVAAPGTLEGAVSKPALATRNLHDMSSTSSTQPTVNNTKRDAKPGNLVHYEMKKYCFKRAAPITVHGTWSGDSLTMDNVIDYVQIFGQREVADWESFGRENKVTLHFDGIEAPRILTHEAAHHILGGSMVNIKVQFNMA
jgi:hypothetical protein